MTDVSDLERDGREIFEMRDLRNVLDIALAIVLVVILSLALLESVVPRVRPSEDVREFELAEAIVITGHGIDGDEDKLARRRESCQFEKVGAFIRVICG